MTQDEKQHLKALLVAMALYYGQEIADAALGLYVEDLEDLALADVQRVLRELRRDPKTTRMPLPAVVRARIVPEAMSDEDLAIEAVNRIFEAVARWGWNNAARAKLMIGELGWKVVEMDGGWLTVCQELTEDNKGTFRAQWKGLALVQIRRAKAGILEAPRLPQASVLPISGFLKQMPNPEAT